MTPELKALYEIHRHQILLNCKDENNTFNLNKAYVYAIDERIYPFFHENWCSGEDPYLSCYTVSKDFITEVITELDRIWLDKVEKIPTFYKLEQKYGRDRRTELIHIIRYCSLNGSFDESVYNSILTSMEHPSEASIITHEYNARHVYLI